MNSCERVISGGESTVNAVVSSSKMQVNWQLLRILMREPAQVLRGAAITESLREQVSTGAHRCYRLSRALYLVCAIITTIKNMYISDPESHTPLASTPAHLLTWSLALPRLGCIVRPCAPSAFSACTRTPARDRILPSQPALREPSMTALFEKRHFDWLAAWAGANLTPAHCARLADALCSTNPQFKRQQFLDAVERSRAPVVERVCRRADDDFR